MIVQPKRVECRKAERFEANTAAKFKNASGGGWFPAKLINVSETGACIYGFVGISSRQVGAYVELFLPNYQGQDRYLVAEVVWGNNEKVGLRFS